MGWRVQPPAAHIAALLLVLGSCGGDRPGGVTPPSDVLLVVVDTLRRDYVSAYGQAPPHTPAMDSVAKEGVLLLGHHATTSQTCPSHASMFTGLHLREHGLLTNGMVLPESVPTLAEVAASAGYRTLGVVGASVLDDRFGLSRGFDVWDDDMPENKGNRWRTVSRRADVVVARALQLIATPDEQPLFLFVHVFDPHAPYGLKGKDLPAPHDPMQGFGGRVEPSSSYATERLAQILNDYAMEVAFADRQLRVLLDAWDARPGADASVVVVTSDHGEGLGEHEYMGHDFHLYEEQIHVPCMIRQRSSSWLQGELHANTSHVDLAATIVDLAGISAPGVLAGRSLVPLLMGDEAPDERTPIAERSLVSEEEVGRSPDLRRLTALGRGIGAQLAVVRGDWKLIWTEDADEELYDLTNDPAEALDLAVTSPGQAADLLGRIQAFQAQARAPATDAGVELLDPDTERILEALGY